MSYGPQVIDITNSYKDDPELRRRVEQMRAQQSQMQGANPNTQDTGWMGMWRNYMTPFVGMAMKQVQGAMNLPGQISSALGSAQQTATLPRRVAEGEVDPMSDEAIGWAADVATMGNAPQGALAAGNKRLAAATVAAKTAAEAPVLTDYRVAQRVPTAKGTPIDPSVHDVRIDVDAMRQDPEFFEKAGNRVGDIVPAHVMTSTDPEEKIGAAKSHMISNLRAIYDRMDPAIRTRAEKWYPGGNILLRDLAQKYGLPDQSAAGAVAALSPQKDWFQNFDLARRLMAAKADDPVITQGMLDRVARTASSGIAAYADDLKDKVGMRLSQLNSLDAGKGAVVHDLTTNARSYPVLGPEGTQLGLDLTKSGKPVNIAWGSSKQVENAMNALRSDGDMSKISSSLGDRHKVRNFYNNLISPDPRWNDYTSDTHNIAASLLRPLAGKDPEVALGLGAGLGSASTGTRGLYGIYADAGRELAKEYGVTPYQVQSPTWEGVRSLFPDTFKSEANKQRAAAIWEGYRKGELTQADAQEMIFKLAPQDVNRVPWR